MTREKYFCPVTGKVDLSQDDSEAEWELLEIVHIIGQSLLKGNEGGSEAGYWKVGPLPQPSHTADPTDVASIFQRPTGRRPPELSLNTSEGCPHTFY